MDLEELERYLYSYGKDVYSFCCSITKNKQEADDLYQDTFLKLYEMRDSLEIHKNPKGFLMSVSVNIYRNNKRKLSIRQGILGSQVPMEECDRGIPDQEPLIEEQYFAREEVHMLRSAVKRLPDKYKIPVLLFYMEEIPLTDISRIMKLPEGTVKSRIHRAKKLLKQMMEEVYYGK